MQIELLSIGHIVAAAILSITITMMLLLESLWFLRKYEGGQFRLSLWKIPRNFIILWFGTYIAWILIGAMGSFLNGVI